MKKKTVRRPRRAAKSKIVPVTPRAPASRQALRHTAQALGQEEITSLKQELKRRLGWTEQPVPGEPGRVQVVKPREIVGIGFGVKHTSGYAAAVNCLRVYVRRKRATSQVAARLRVPKTISGVPTDVIAVGGLHARAASGDSASHFAISSGTLGCVVEDAAQRRYLLSNNHVFANLNQGSPGDPILMPSPGDGGLEPAVAHLATFKALTFEGIGNDFDAAIAEIAPTANIDPAINGIGSVNTGIVEPHAGLEVAKHGRTTLLTSGFVDGLNEDIDMMFDHNPAFTAHFTNQISIIGANQRFSEGGDSGSLIVTLGTHQAVALLVGSAESDSRTIASRIEPILTHFGVTIV